MASIEDIRNFIRWYPLTWIRFTKRFFKEWKTNPLSLRYAIKAYFTGFYPDAFIAYSLHENNYKNYLSDLSYYRISRPNGKRSIILDDKLLFERFFRGIMKVPINYSLILRGKIIPIDEGKTIESVDDILCYRKDGLFKIVLKPFRGDKGHGVTIVSVSKNMVQINQERMGFGEFRSFVSGLDGYIITEYIEQGLFTKNIFPDAVNTVRILTIINPTTLKPFVAGAALRIGTRKSAPLDNMSQGGLSASIDLETGGLGRATMSLSHSKSKNKVVWYDKHPDTGKQMAGLQIPNWRNVTDTIIGVAGSTPYIPYIGWDICICEKGIAVIEGNSGPGFRIFQMHKPLLQDNRIKHYCGYYNIC